MNRHLIYTNGRSGSNAFVQLLNQHPQVTNYGEVLGDWTLPGKHIRPRFSGPDGNARYLDWFYDDPMAFRAAQAVSYLSRKRRGAATHYRRRQDIKSIGLKEFASNFHKMGLEDYLADRADIHLITLLRENTIARYLSSETLRQTGTVARKDGDDKSEVPALALPTDGLVAELDLIARENDWVREGASRHQGPVMNVLYEDYFSADEAGQRAALEEMQRFIGVDPVPLTLEHKKLRKAPLSQSISNFDEVAQVLSGTSHAAWLDKS
ncbi:hypothetical protein [Parvularcula sp. LCG005]|uniref:hypothetical protein n=1 Tax=Parvularcula sp. LCG005 TaxID=3078805 RepID=UPI00294296FC|nr:hypothetical protein [Parvularcula sp. LCG005]WOI53239.1 hypothetical protein RUI03_13915 [Parvularcula sp. LCG005]